MKKAVMYGAGNIGRGFIGQVLRDSGYRVVFVDVNMAMVDAFNQAGQYTQVIVDGDACTERVIDQVSAVHGGDALAVIAEIATCDLLAISVGAAVLPLIAPNIAKGIMERMGRPLNILICENLIRSHDVLGDLLCSVPGFDRTYLAHVGLVRTTIGRMVPTLSEEMQRENPTMIAVEPYCELPMDLDALVGDPQIAHAVPYSPFSFMEEKKLYIHNMGHALTAYLGNLKGYSLIWEAISDTEIFARAKEAMLCVAQALAAEYDVDLPSLSTHVDDLLVRFGNRALGDPVSRVGRDPMRKLAPGDRFIGALHKCKANGVAYEPILHGIAAALCYEGASDDPSAAEMMGRIGVDGAMGFLQSWCQLDEADSGRCAGIFETLK